ncbi:Non-specific lipid-transfer protein [Sesamum angolense]|uniref:Non-specific lipid-transfer protein n=1 Tax=Sesamum angolense TaxID=2727404 RepID=A0AAE1WM00_9LAMI|nr:Non-specific lipid-transfer protein [Sesamum angolense]
MLTVCVIALAPRAQGLTCSDVVEALLPCQTFLKQGGNVPGNCCSGVKSLDKAANTGALRQTVCQCLQAAGKADGVNAKYAAALPKQCNITVGYAISYSTDCSKVH